MKNITKILKSAFVLIVIIMLSNVYADYADYSDTTVDFPTHSDNTLWQGGTFGNIWATFAFVVRILALGAVVFAGVRYMFASADKKADIKRGLVYLAIGAILVFGATLVIELVVNASNEIISGNTASPAPSTPSGGTGSSGNGSSSGLSGVVQNILNGIFSVFK